MRPVQARTSGAVAAWRIGWRANPLAAAALLALTSAGAGGIVAAAWAAKRMFDALAEQRTQATMAVLFGLLAAAIGTAVALCRHVAGYLTQVLQADITVLVNERLFSRVNSFPGIVALEDPAFQDRIQLAQQAAQQAPYLITSLAASTAQSATLVVGFGAVLFTMWPLIGILVLLSGVPDLLAQLKMARVQVEAARCATGAVRAQSLAQRLILDVRAGREIRLFGVARFFQDRMTGSLRTANRIRLGAERRLAIVQGAQTLLAFVVTGVATMLAVRGVAAGDLTIGDVAMVLAAAGSMQTGLAALAAQAGRASEVLRLFKYYLEIVTSPDDLPTGSVITPPLSREIEFRDVWFRYENGPWVLRGLNLRIPCGESTALVGVNGAGKSTIVKLVCRFYDPQAGRILWDGIDLRELDPQSLRRRIGITFQDYMCYDLTAAENIGIGQVELLNDAAALARAARDAEIAEVVEALPRGYNTLLSRYLQDDADEAGVTLSGGQWQRIALARSLLRSASDLLILDESNAHLDADAEHRLRRTLARLRQGKTSLLISHRLATLRDSAMIAVLVGGQVTEAGSHSDLMARGSEYARLFNLQAAGYEQAAHATGATG